MGRNTQKNTSATSPSKLQTQEQKILSALPSDAGDKKMLQTRLLQWTGLIHRSGLLQSVTFAERKSDNDKGWKAALKTVQSVLAELGEGSLKKLHDLDLIEYQRLQLLTLEVTALGTRYLDAQLALEKLESKGENQ